MTSMYIQVKDRTQSEMSWWEPTPEKHVLPNQYMSDVMDRKQLFDLVVLAKSIAIKCLRLLYFTWFPLPQA